MSSCVCQSYGHFQCPVGEQLGPPCFFSAIANHFCRGKSDGFSIRQKETQNRTKPQPTTGQISYAFGMNARVEERIKFSGPERVRVSFGTGKIYRSFGMGTTLTPKPRVRGVFRRGEIPPFLESAKFYALFHSGVGEVPRTNQTKV